MLLMTFILSFLYPQVPTRLASGWRNVMLIDDSTYTAVGYRVSGEDAHKAD